MLSFLYRMPAHFTHCIFGEDALTQSLGDQGSQILKQHGNLFRVACQGPDIFYHNQRTKPSGLKYGALIHRKQYGKLVLNMLTQACNHERTVPPELRAYVLGFITHAFLDRKTHPFIMYFSGWVNSTEKESRRFFRCHAFLERILDVLILQEERTATLQEFDFLSQIVCDVLPEIVIGTLARAIRMTYSDNSPDSEECTRIRNAHADTMFFYHVTNHRRLHYLYSAYELDRSENFRKRRIALFHPLELPVHIDFLNLKRNTWNHPCCSEDQYSLSFMDLYREALQEIVPVLRAVDLGMTEKQPPADIESRIGNESLDTGKHSNRPCVPLYSAPFPLPELMEDIYLKLEKQTFD